MIPPRLVLATANRGKLEELRALVAEWGPAEVRSLADFPGVTCPEETGGSYLENALAKARTVAAATALPALADDSGLEAEGLGGAPGVRSARYAPSDAARVARLLAELAGVPRAARRACFRCVVALAWPGGAAVTAEARAAAGSRPPRAAAAGSATIRCSSPTGSAAPSPPPRPPTSSASATGRAPCGRSAPDSPRPEPATLRGAGSPC